MPRKIRDLTEDEQLAGALALELADKEAEPMELRLRPVTVFQLTALIQLALRHPGVTTDLRTTGETFLAAVRNYFVDCPQILDVVRRGDDPSEDR